MAKRIKASKKGVDIYSAMFKLDHFTGVMGIPSGSEEKKWKEATKKNTNEKKKKKKVLNPPFSCACVFCDWLRDPALPEA